MDSQSTGLRKRQQISRANKMMFLWVAGVSVVVGISIVLTIFLAQRILFGEKVIAEKNKTASTLEANLKAVATLKDNINVLNTNENLKTTTLSESDPPIQSVLDALPAVANSTALASSLQTKLLVGVAGITLESVSVDATDSDQTVDASTPAPAATDVSGSGANQIGFTFAVSASIDNYAALQQVLERLEKSIRPMTVTSLSVEGQGDRVTMTVTGVSYYGSAKSIQLTDKVLKP